MTTEPDVGSGRLRFIRGRVGRALGNSFLRGVIAIGGGTLFAQVVLTGASPLISRIYSPAEVGIYTVVASVAAILGGVASLRFDFAIPLPERERDAYGVVALGLISVIVTTLGATAILLLFGVPLTRAFNQPNLMPWLLLGPVAAGCQGMQRVLNQLAVRHRRYRSIATRNVFRAVVTSVSQVGLGLVGFKAGGLVLGLGAGNVAGSMALLSGSRLRAPEARDGRSLPSLHGLLRRYRKFPLMLAPSGLLNVLGNQAPILLISYHFGSAVTGWLGLTQTVLALPVALLGQAVAQVYLGEIARAKRSGDRAYGALFGKTSRNLGIVAGLMTAFLVGLAPVLFPFVFGSNWVVSGEYARILAPAFGLQLLVVPLSQTLVVSGRQGRQFMWDGGRLLITAVSVLTAASLGASATQTVIIFSAASAAAYCVLWLMARSAVREPAHELRQSGLNAD